MAILKTYIVRSSIKESVHEAKCIVKNIDYKTIFKTKQEKELIYPRSAIKILQAIPFIQSNAHRNFNLNEKEIAISCASHCGENIHLVLLNRWINKLGIKKKKITLWSS